MPRIPSTHKPNRASTPSTAKHTQTRTQRGYDNVWLRLSRMCLIEEPLCRYCCEEGRLTVAQVSDHIIPLRVRPDLRLVRENIQSLCTACHSGRKQREELELYGL